MEKAMGNTRAEARLLGNIGEAWHDFGDFDQAQQYLALALQMDLPANHRDAVARHISSLARIYRRQAQWAEAARWVEAALTLSRQIGANIYLAENLFTAAELAFQKEDWQTAETLLLECLPLAHNKSGRPIHLPVTILLLQTQVRQQKITAPAAIDQLESLLPTYPDPAHQAALQDAIWQLNPARQDARQKAAEQYQTAHQKFPHILFRQRHTALTGAALTPPNITMETPVVEPAETPPPHNLDQLYTQLVALLSK
jgi:tetratricopeptide (TPR) repeat protein